MKDERAFITSQAAIFRTLIVSMLEVLVFRDDGFELCFATPFTR
jgi:hypothetical protein